MPENIIDQETVTQIRTILEKSFAEGQHWLKSTALNDWRRAHYSSSRRRRTTGPSIKEVILDVRPLLGYLEKEVSEQTAATYNYIIIKPDDCCLKENGIVLLRPVLKKNFDHAPRLNFHVWFHCMPSGEEGEHLMNGWRFEEPEGGGSNHNFYHAQPLRRFGSEGHSYGVHNRASERFPTFPLPASNTLELCLNAILVACGKDALRSLIRNSADGNVRKAATEFWTKIFGNTIDEGVETKKTTA